MQTFPQMSAKHGHNIIQGTWVVPLKQFVLQKLYNEKMFCRTLATGSQLSPSLTRRRCGNWGHDQWVQAGGGLALGLGKTWRCSPTLMVLWLSEMLWHFRMVLFGKKMKMKILMKIWNFLKSTICRLSEDAAQSSSHSEMVWTFSRNNEKSILNSSGQKRTSSFLVKFHWNTVFPRKPTWFSTNLVLGFWVSNKSRYQHEAFKNSFWELMGKMSFSDFSFFFFFIFLWITGFWLNHWKKRMSLWQSNTECFRIFSVLGNTGF